MDRVYRYDGFMETVSLAESLGWEDTYNWRSFGVDDVTDQWTLYMVDECEEECLEYIRNKGYVIAGLDWLE